LSEAENHCFEEVRVRLTLCSESAPLQERRLLHVNDVEPALAVAHQNRAGHYCEEGTAVPEVCPRVFYCPEGTGTPVLRCSPGTWNNVSTAHFRLWIITRVTPPVV
jgi:hypothetical protein